MQGDELGRGVVVGVGIGVVLPLGRVGDAPARGMDPKARALDEHVVAAAIDLAEAVVAPVLAPAVPDFPVGNGGAVVGDVDAPADHLDDVVGVPLGAVALGFFDDADADVGHHGVRGDVARDGARARDLGHDGARRRERPDVGGGGQPTKVLDADARVRRRRAWVCRIVHIHVLGTTRVVRGLSSERFGRRASKVVQTRSPVHGCGSMRSAGTAQHACWWCSVHAVPGAGMQLRQMFSGAQSIASVAW
mmetsp:Transcript_23966/g.95104  ORF Transcript_23966/g.95104 Transcript_23966/m.95104 type:complete len:248 (+) Transcript_23966:391-1134(+)